MAISAVAGMGGVGKTELALQYAKDYWDKYYPGGVCWLRVQEQDVASQIVEFALLDMGLQVPQELAGQHLNLEQQVRWIWNNWQPPENNILVVLDDVASYASVKPYLPTDKRFKVLMTTRERFASPVVRLDLDVLSPEAALDLLKSLAGEERFTDVEAQYIAPLLCEWLGYLPLGLELVGRYLATDEDLTVAEVWEELQEESLHHEAIAETPQEMQVKLGVAAAFELSWRRLDAKAQILACWLSLFALAPISWELAMGIFKEESHKELKKVRRSLVNLNLLKRVDKETYQLNSLIREFLREKQKQFDADEIRRNFCKAMVAQAMKIFQTMNLEQIATVTPWIPHLAEAATTWQDWVGDEDIFWSFTGLCFFYEAQGIYQQAIPWCEKCLQVAQTRLRDNHLDVAASLHNLAGLYSSQGRYEEAETLYVKALELFKKLLGDNHPYVAKSLNNLALLYRYQGRYEEAETLFLQALALSKSLLGDNYPYVAKSFHNLAGLYSYQGRYEEAETLFLQALELFKQFLGDNHPDVATSLNNLAGLYYYQERYAESEPLSLQALSILLDRLGEKHPKTQTFLENFVYFLQQVIAAGKETELSDHPWTQSLIEQIKQQ